MQLAIEDIYPLLEAVPNSEKITLVGGQALNFWAEMYFSNDIELHETYGPFISKDVDFIGGRDAVLECAKAWGGEARFPEPFDPSPNSGLVIIPFDEKNRLIVDFLIAVHGIENSTLKRQRLKMHYKETILFVAHPLHCLQSRVSNVIGLNRDSVYSMNQLKTGIAVMNKRFIKLLDAGRRRQALKEIEQLFNIACHSMLGLPLLVDYRIDLIESIPRDERLGQAFIERRLPQMRRKLNTKQERIKRRRQIQKIRKKSHG